MLSIRLFCFSLLCIVLLGLRAPLWADRIYLIDGKTIKGTVQKFGRRVWEVQKRDGSIEKVPRYKIANLIFNASGVERGYAKAFLRVLVGLGYAEYPISLRDKNADRDLGASYPPVRLGSEFGWMVDTYRLALHSGLEYSHSNFITEEDPGYRYLSLTVGASYYPHLGNWNFYLKPHLRLALNGDFFFKHDEADVLSIPIEADGLGFGFSVAWERHLSDSLMSAIALSYTVDNLISRKQVIAADVGRLPRDVELTEDQKVGLTYFGINISLVYD